jgi:hypothetical protein
MITNLDHESIYNELRLYIVRCLYVDIIILLFKTINKLLYLNNRLFMNYYLIKTINYLNYL